MKYYLNSFLLYSILGYLLETFLKTFFFSHMNNGIMFGPWIPVYGFGCCLIIVIMRFIFNRVKVNRIVKIFLVFLFSFFILTILEWIGGVLIEKLFGKVFWDYSDLKFNFGHYIALEMSLIWGGMSLVIIYLIKPLIDRIIKKIPGFLTYLAFVFFLIDLLFTIVKMK